MFSKSIYRKLRPLQESKYKMICHISKQFLWSENQRNWYAENFSLLSKTWYIVVWLWVRIFHDLIEQKQVGSKFQCKNTSNIACSSLYWTRAWYQCIVSTHLFSFSLYISFYPDLICLFQSSKIYKLL